MGLFRGVMKIFELIYEEGEKEWLNEEKYKDELKELYMIFEQGKISEEAYEAQEEQLLKQLKTIRQYKIEHGYTD